MSVSRADVILSDFQRFWATSLDALIQDFLSPRVTIPTEVVKSTTPTFEQLHMRFKARRREEQAIVDRFKIELHAKEAASSKAGASNQMTIEEYLVQGLCFFWFRQYEFAMGCFENAATYGHFATAAIQMSFQEKEQWDKEKLKVMKDTVAHHRPSLRFYERALAINLVGECYLSDESPNLKEADRLFKDAEERGSAKASLNRARIELREYPKAFPFTAMNFESEKEERNAASRNAYEFLSRSMKLGCPEAFFRITIVFLSLADYQEGRKASPQAIENFEKAAEYSAESAYQLAKIYEAKKITHDFGTREIKLSTIAEAVDCQRTADGHMLAYKLVPPIPFTERIIACYGNVLRMSDSKSLKSQALTALASLTGNNALPIHIFSAAIACEGQMLPVSLRNSFSELAAYHPHSLYCSLIPESLYVTHDVLFDQLPNGLTHFSYYSRRGVNYDFIAVEEELNKVTLNSGAISTTLAYLGDPRFFCHDRSYPLNPKATTQSNTVVSHSNRPR